MAQEILNVEHGKVPPRFNCELLPRVISNVCIAAVGKEPINRSRMIETPFLTNSIQLERGEELVLEIAEKIKKQSQPRDRSWRDVMKEGETRSKKDINKRPPTDTPGSALMMLSRELLSTSKRSRVDA